MTCRNCGKSIDKENAIYLFYNHYVCSDECKKFYTKSEGYCYDKMLDYIWTKCNRQGNYRMYQSQAEYYHNHYNMKYSAMLITVKYWFEIENNTFNLNYGIGQIFPSAYERAEKYYKERMVFKQKVENVDMNTLKNNKVISVKNLQKRNDLIDMEDEDWLGG